MGRVLKVGQRRRSPRLWMNIAATLEVALLFVAPLIYLI